MKKNRILAVSMSATLSAIMAVGCSQPPDPQPDFSGFETDGVTQTAETDFLSNGSGLKSGGFTLSFVKTDDYGIEISNGEETVFHQKKPVELTVRGETVGVVSTYKEIAISEGYDKIEKHDFGIAATGNVTTEGGSELTVYDLWFVISEGNFGVSRNVEVKKKGERELGFSTSVRFRSKTGKTSMSDYDVTFPSLVYRDSSHIPSSAIGAYLDVSELYVRETAMGMPYVFLRDKETESSITVAHYQPEVSVNGVEGGGLHGECNDKLQYGSFGYKNDKDGVNVGFVYPCTEGPSSYNSTGWATRFHQMEEGVNHKYKISVIPTSDMTYQDAFTYSTLKAYGTGMADIFDADLDAVYSESFSLLSEVHSEVGQGAVKASGVPFALPLDEARKDTFDSPSMQMGFVGAQTSLAAQMINYGYLTEDDELLAKGTGMIDFWTSSNVYPESYKLPIVWWDRYENAQGGGPRRTAVGNLYPAFLRMLCDGMDGIMEAHKYVEKHGGEAPEAWMNAVLRVADFFLGAQNEDGSLYRAYDQILGGVNTDTSDMSYQGSSKLNTATVVPFFYKVADYLREKGETARAEEFEAGALAATEYAYNEIYMRLGKFVGGTIDQHNIVDKEAGIFATRAFTAAYLATGEARYLAAAEHAACFVLTFTYTYDFAVPCSDPTVAQYNPFDEGGASGFSIIATGHSGSDIFAAYTVFDFYKLYVLTGKEVYKNIAIFMENNTKQAVDYDGRHGFLYTATAPEASGLHKLNYGTVDSPGIWLPWNTDACIRPMSDLVNYFGTYHIDEIEYGLEEQRQILQAYGLGGRNVE